MVKWWCIAIAVKYTDLSVQLTACMLCEYQAFKTNSTHWEHCTSPMSFHTIKPDTIHLCTGRNDIIRLHSHPNWWAYCPHRDGQESTQTAGPNNSTQTAVPITAVVTRLMLSSLQWHWSWMYFNTVAPKFLGLCVYWHRPSASCRSQVIVKEHKNRYH